MIKNIKKIEEIKLIKKYDYEWKGDESKIKWIKKFKIWIIKIIFNKMILKRWKKILIIKF